MSFLASFLAATSFYGKTKSLSNEEKDGNSLASDEERCGDLKSRLRSLLDLHDGSIKEPDIVETIESLAALSPYQQHSREWLDLFTGEFLTQTSPSFPGRLPTKEGDKRAQYSLGKLSFNTFHPSDLVCTLRGVKNVVAPKSDGTFTYDLICDTIVHLPEGDVEAEIVNESYCCKDDESNRVHVFFTGSRLSPSNTVIEDDGKMSLWSRTFNNNTLEIAESKRSYFGWMMNKMLKRMLGMKVRFDDSNSFRLEFQKPFHGHFDVLYLDNELRVTRGNRGTIVVVERIM